MPDGELLLYTRRYLARNHLLTPQPITYCRLPPVAPITDIRDPFTFSSCDDLDIPILPIFNGSEKLVLAHETAIYLSSIIKVPQQGQELFEKDMQWSKSRRIEEPLVGGKRRKKVHKVREDVFQDIPLGMGGDVGISWDRNVRRQVWEYVRNTEAERMTIGPGVLQFLQDVHRPKSLPPTMEIIREEFGYCRPEDSEFMTPPLLPSSPVTLPSFLRLAETLDLAPIDAGQTSSLVADLTESFMEEDSILFDAYSDLPPSFLQLVPPTPSPIRKRPRPETMMVEVILTPPASTTKRVRFSDLELPPRIGTPDRQDNVESELEGKQILVRVDQELAQEQLQEADSTLRIEVPVMDISRPRLPWEESGNGLEQLRALEQWAGFAARKWVGSGSVGMDLSWRPFSRSAIKIPIEGLEDARFIDGLVVKSEEGEVCEKILLEGLRPLRLEEFEDDTELESGVFSKKIDDIKTLLKRKKKRIRPQLDDRTQITIDEGASLRPGREASSLQRSEGILSNNSLDTFMALRSRVAKKPTSNSTSRIIQTDPDKETTPKPKPKDPIVVSSPQDLSFPVPNIKLPASPGTFIASITLLTERQIFRLIKDIYPTATIIERDFSVPIPDTFAGAPQNQNDADHEADLILSPLSGVIITSLQKIRQAPLPGHALSTIRQRVANVALLYERLFVLVLGTVRGSDAETIAGFIAFAIGLQAGVYVRVITDDKEVVATSVVALMVREGSTARLLEDETLWERFLRKAGFNAFAAQVVLRECRDGGLRGFLKMEVEDKRRLFQEVVGNRALERVLWRLERKWDVEGV